MRPKPIFASNALIPGGHYSQAVVAQGLIFVSGQLGVGRGEPASRPVDEQIRRVLDSLCAILAQHEAGLEHVAKITLYITDIAHWPLIDEVYADVFGPHKPARSIVPVPALHHGAAVELEAIASDPHG